MIQVASAAGLAGAGATAATGTFTGAQTMPAPRPCRRPDHAGSWRGLRVYCSIRMVLDAIAASGHGGKIHHQKGLNDGHSAGGVFQPGRAGAAGDCTDRRPAFPGGPGGRDAPLHREPEPEKVRQEVMAHFQASVERNRRLGQLPADS